MSNISILNKLNEESLSLDRDPNQSVLNTNAYTISLYKTITQLIYKDIVKITPTRTRIANVFCWENVNANGDLIQNTPATYTGKFGVKERKIIEDNGFVFPTKTDFKKDDFFIFNDVVFQSIKDSPFASLVGTDSEKINMAIFFGHIRYASEASNKVDYTPSETSFRLRSWRGNVGTRRTELEITTEASQDVSRVLGQETEQVIIDAIATNIADDINKDIIHTLINVSKRYLVNDSVPYVDLSKTTKEKYLMGRELYSIVTDMIAKVTSDTKYTPNYVVTSPRVAGLINSSGMSESINKSSNIKDTYVLNDGTILRVDVTATFDFIVVGVSNNNASSIYMSNLVQDVDIIDNDEKVSSMALGTYNIIKAVNTNSMSDRYLCQSRYALTTSPYTYSDESEKDHGILYGDRWTELSGKSPLSRFVGVILPTDYKVD